MKKYIILSLVLLSSISYADEEVCQQSQIENNALADLSQIAEFTQKAEYTNYCVEKMQSNTFIFEEDYIYCENINNKLAAACVASVGIHDDIFSPGAFEVEACASINNEYALKCVQKLDFSDAFYGASYMEIYNCADVQTQEALSCVESQPFGESFEEWTTFLEISNCAEEN